MSGATSEPERSSSRKEVSGRASGREHNQHIFGAAAESRLPASSQAGSPVAAAAAGEVGGRGGGGLTCVCVVGRGVGDRKGAFVCFVEAAPHTALLRRC